MSIHFDASRGRFVVRWKQDGRRRIRRFASEAEAIAFDASLLRPIRRAPIAESMPSTPAGDGVYAYETRAGTRATTDEIIASAITQLHGQIHDA